MSFPERKILALGVRQVTTCAATERINFHYGSQRSLGTKMMAICTTVIKSMGDDRKVGMPPEQNPVLGRPQVMVRPVTTSTQWLLVAHGSDRRAGKIAKLINLESRLRPLP